MNRRPDFAPLHVAMQKAVDDKFLPGLSSAVLIGRDVADLHCTGFADRENGIALRPDHLFRVFSNTKLATSCAVLQLWEAGRLGLDDPIETYLPALGNRRVLKRGAERIDDSEPARSSITVRHLMSHSSGLSYGLLDPGTPMFKAYSQRRIARATLTLEQMVDALADLPLSFHPGTAWEYSIATDVLARLVEVVSGERFDDYLRTHVFAPLGMRDTFFVVPEAKRARLTAYYRGFDVMAPLVPGLVRTDEAPYPGAYLKPMPKLSGGGGLVSSLHDQIALVKSLLPGGPTLLKPDTIALMMRNQLPDGVTLRFPMGAIPGRGHGLAGGVVMHPLPTDSRHAGGEFYWGGIAGTQWWIAPRHNLAGLIMTQRQMAFFHPALGALKRTVYDCVLGQ